MTIAADSRYRSVSLEWTNNDQVGNELVQMLAKPDGGAWSVANTYAVGGPTQTASWDTALPVTDYDIAFRYMNKSVPASGYESSNPDDWTAPTAAGSKSTVTTTSESVTLAASGYVNASTPITLTWSSAQQGVPYLLEKNTGMGWTTVIADLVATNYQYTIPGAELATTVQFRVTAKRGSVTGPVSNSVSVYMGFVTGVATISGGYVTIGSTPIRLFVTWSINSQPSAVANRFEVEYSTNGGGAWTSGGVSTLSAPAIENAPSQPDGYLACNYFAFAQTVADMTTVQFRARVGYYDGSVTTWGSYSAVYYAVYKASPSTITSPSEVVSNLTRQGATVTPTIPGGVATALITFAQTTVGRFPYWLIRFGVPAASSNPYAVLWPPPEIAATAYLAVYTNGGTGSSGSPMQDVSGSAFETVSIP